MVVKRRDGEQTTHLRRVERKGLEDRGECGVQQSPAQGRAGSLAGVWEERCCQREQQVQTVRQGNDEGVSGERLQLA